MLNWRECRVLQNTVKLVDALQCVLHKKTDFSSKQELGQLLLNFA